MKNIHNIYKKEMIKKTEVFYIENNVMVITMKNSKN